MTATLHEIEFRYDGCNFLVAGEVEGPTDTPKVEISLLEAEGEEEYKAMINIAADCAPPVIAAACDALIKAAEDRGLVYSCGDCGVECYGEPPDCGRCEDRKEAAIDRARGK